MSERRGLLLFVLAGVGVAAALRVWTLASPIGALDADEAVWGLMSHYVLEGELPVFFWDQTYGGSHEALLSAPVVAIAGMNTLAIRIVPLALFAVASVLVWRVGRRTVGEPAAIAAGVFLAVWPPYLVWKSTRAHGFYGAMLVLTLLVLLFALRVVERPSRRAAALLGLAVGLAWWAGPLSAAVLLPTAAWLVVRLGRDVGRLWPAVPTALVGGLPWLVWNAQHDFASLEPPFGSFGDDYLDHLRTFLFATFPAALGLRTPFSLDWVVPEAIARVASIVALLLLWSMLLRDPSRRLLGAVALVYPFVQALSPFASLNAEPRYLVLLAPVIALGLADLVGRTLTGAALAIVVLSGLSVIGIHQLNEQRPVVPPVGEMRVPADLGPALRTLERLGIDRVRAHYAIAYRITFETDERIIASPRRRSRRPEYDEIVARDPRPAYVAVLGSPADRLFARPGYRRIVAGDWAVFVPTQ
jgi:4-amino-4-deoxy-L-arabinose transferase-like glycosyltransferase